MAAGRCALVSNVRRADAHRFYLRKGMTKEAYYFSIDVNQAMHRTAPLEPVKYWEIIADRLHAEGWSYGIAEHLTKQGLLFCVDARRDGKRFIVKADHLLTAFLSLERDVTAAKGANGNTTQ
jgi:hypothetical protein